MGYRSDVALCLTPEAEQTLRGSLKEAQKILSPDDFYSLKDFITCSQTFKDENGSTLRYWSWCKWYREDPVISFIENMIAELDSSRYLFLRIGEDLDDIERGGDFYDNPFKLNVCISITFNSHN